MSSTNAVAEILWVAGDERKAVVCVPREGRSGVSPLNVDQAAQNLQLCTFTSKESLAMALGGKGP